jgi:hypothetical protein
MVSNMCCSIRINQLPVYVTSGLFYKHIAIVNDNSGVVNMRIISALQAVASPTIMILTTLEV